MSFICRCSIAWYKSLKSVEMLPLTLKSFASSLALLISPPYRHSALLKGVDPDRSALPIPLEGVQAPRFRSYPYPWCTQPSTGEKNVDTALVSQGLFSLPDSPLQVVGLCHVGVVSTSGTAETHLVLRVWGLQCRCNPCTSAQSFSTGLENIIINSSNQWGFYCWGFLKLKPELLILHENIGF